MSTSVKVSLAMVAIAAIVLAVMLAVNNSQPGESARSGDAPSGPADPKVLVREDSPRLSEGTEAQFVEYLDFECEACLEVFPVVESLREQYGDKVEFVVRYLPLHGNSMRAAQAAEAARQQGKFEDMYTKLFETAEQWGHKEESQEKAFFTYAEEIGLDMEKFRADYDDPATTKRIEQSQQDAQELGVTGTPTFFMNGEMFQPKSPEELRERFATTVDG